MSTTDIGRLGEKIAVRYLRRNGYKILERNIHQSHNEIDIIATDKSYIVFVEVKTRTTKGGDTYLPYGSPAASVTKSKQMRIISAANQYISRNSRLRHVKKQPRMDVIEIYLEKENNKLIKLNHITNAFGAN